MKQNENVVYIKLISPFGGEWTDSFKKLFTI